MYESTGQYGRSSLRKVKLATGEIDQSLNLPREIFGEGLTMFDDRLIQISWKNQTGYVYDKKNFRELAKLSYQTEGWGICYDGSRFIMSDGSEILYVMDKENFSELARIEVYDNLGPVKQLNELEYINGRIYANVYGADYVVVIDPISGAVLEKINFKRIVPAMYEGDLDHTLNGIAWNPENGHLFITGKEWPVIHEVTISR
jgi:glutaminyl-peptide cyclotransferase